METDSLEVNAEPRVLISAITKPARNKKKIKIICNDQLDVDKNQQEKKITPQSVSNNSDLQKNEKFFRTVQTAMGGIELDLEEEKEMQAIIEDKWQDNSPDLVEGIFYVNQTNIFVRCCCKKRSDKQENKILIHDYRALYCLHFKHRFRIELVNFTSSNMFDSFIILLIFLNSIILAIYDYNDRENLLEYNQRLDSIGHVFTILFACEMVLKILAQGFILHNNAYLRDWWNWLDFIVVVTGIMELMNLSWFKVRALRTLRVLRPLRSINAFPKMRQLVSSLVGSVSSLLNAVVFMLFIFMLFGILGIQQFQGTMYKRCRFTEEPLSDGSWPIDEDLEFLCSQDGQGLMECPADRFCKQPVDAGLPASIDKPFEQEMIFYNLIGFDNLGWAMLTIFQMITLEQWTTVMYLLMDSNIWWMAVFFCVALVLIGSFFLLNVILAVLADALNMVESMRIKQDSARLNKIKRSLDRAEAQNGKIISKKEEEPKDEVKELETLQKVDDQIQTPQQIVRVNSEESLHIDQRFADTNLNVSQIIDQSILPERSQQNKIYYICHRICTHWTFTVLITILIIGNTVVLAMESYPEEPEKTRIADLLNKVFTWAFLFEMIIKLVGIGFREYARDSFNLFDAFIVVMSLVDMIVSATLSTESPTSALSAFRGVRLLRVFKLARSWTSFRKILAKIMVTIKDVSTFSVLLLMFMFIFSLLGMELFGHKVKFYDDQYQSPGDKDYDQSESPRPNFDNIGMSITMIFAIAVGDDWNYFMALAYRAQGGIALCFYPLVFIFMNLVLLNLFLAILLQNFEESEKQNESKEEQTEDKAFNRLQKSINQKTQNFRRCCVKKFPCCTVAEAEKSSDDEDKDQVKKLRQEKLKSKGKVNELDQNQSPSISNQPEKQLQSQRSDLSITSKNIDLNTNPKSMIPFVDNSNENDEFSFSINVDDQSSKQEKNSSITPSSSGASLKFGQKADYKPMSMSQNESAQWFYKRTSTLKLALLKVNRLADKELPEQYRIDNLQKMMLKSQNNDTYEVVRDRTQQLTSSIDMLANTNKLVTITSLKMNQLAKEGRTEKRVIKMLGSSLFLFSKENCLRKVCYNIVKHELYDSLVLLLIGISTILLTLDNPNMDEQGELARVLGIFDFVLTSLFTLECMINIVLFGFICNGKYSYMRDSWNVMDLLIVIFSILTIILQKSGGGADLSILKVFRMLRVLRPLRVLKRNLGLKIQVVSLMNAIPGIGNLMLISGLILMIFGIQAVGLLKGTLYYCQTDNVPDYTEGLIMTKWDCMDYGGDWVNQLNNFDNVMNAMVTMFGMMSTEGWLEVMWSAVDSTKVNQMPLRNNNPFFILFFSVFMIIGSLFILNLFVGVVINTFNIEKEKLSRNTQLTDLQDEYCEVLTKCYLLKPVTKVIQTGNKCRDMMSRIAQHPAFEIFIFICICINTVVLAMSWYGMDQQILDVLEILNYIFTVIYTIEMVIKMSAFGKLYFKDTWCVFDFSIVLSAWIGLILLKVFNIDVGSISTIIRSFRIARVLKLIKTAKNLQKIFQAFIMAIPEMINVGALLMLFLFLFAVLGVSLFAEIKLQNTMDRHANFENFGRALLTLLRVSTGEGWVGIMQDAARSPSILFQCIKNQSYESKVADGIQGCGSSSAHLYFFLFILMVSLVFLNLFIAIILEGFAASAQEQKIRVGEECFEAFARAWCKHDPTATGKIDVDKLEELIMDLIVEEIEIVKKVASVNKVNFNLSKLIPLKYYTKWKRNMLDDHDLQSFLHDIKENKVRQKVLSRHMRRYVSQLQVPLYNNLTKVQFHDTLQGIIGTVYQRLQKHYVYDRQLRIQTKIKVGEELFGLEGIKIGSVKFWKLPPGEQEMLLERTDEDFQKVINRMENKGNVHGQEIMKLMFMRRLRKRVDAKFVNQLSVLENDQKEQKLFDSSHFLGGMQIQKIYLKLKKERQRPKCASTQTIFEYDSRRKNKKNSVTSSNRSKSVVEQTGLVDNLTENYSALDISYQSLGNEQQFEPHLEDKADNKFEVVFESKMPMLQQVDLESADKLLRQSQESEKWRIQNSRESRKETETRHEQFIEDIRNIVQQKRSETSHDASRVLVYQSMLPDRSEIKQKAETSTQQSWMMQSNAHVIKVDVTPTFKAVIGKKKKKTKTKTTKHAVNRSLQMINETYQGSAITNAQKQPKKQPKQPISNFGRDLITLKQQMQNVEGPIEISRSKLQAQQRSNLRKASQPSPEHNLIFAQSNKKEASQSSMGSSGMPSVQNIELTVDFEQRRKKSDLAKHLFDSNFRPAATETELFKMELKNYRLNETKKTEYRLDMKKLRKQLHGDYNLF